jgi:formylmethanofuran dehydrogenase subunit C
VPRKILITPEDIGQRVTKAKILVVKDGTFLGGKDSKVHRAKANYEVDIPRCSNCAGRVYAVRIHENGHVRTTLGCSVLNIKTVGNACCDEWVGHKGEALDGTVA